MDSSSRSQPSGSRLCSNRLVLAYPFLLVPFQLPHSPTPGLGGAPQAAPLPAPASAPKPAASSPVPPAGFQESFQVHEPAPILTAPGPAQSCSVTLVDRSFANSYGSPSYLSFDPQASFAGSACSDPSSWTGLTLDLHGETRGRQFDRLGTVWVGNNASGQGVEVFRFDNPEPTRNGVYWDISKDVGKYWSLWSKKADIVFDLPNIVDSTYTGALNVTLKLTASVDGSIASSKGHKRHNARSGQHKRDQKALPLEQRAADVVIPLSKRLQTNNSIFLVGGTAGNGTTSVDIPQNAARAIVEVYASGTATEEFWYTGIPDQFYNAIPDAAADGYYGHGRIVKFSYTSMGCLLVSSHPIRSSSRVASTRCSGDPAPIMEPLISLRTILISRLGWAS